VIGGSAPARSAIPKPQNDPYADLAARENAQLAAHEKLFADMAVSDERDRITGNEKFTQMYGQTPASYYGDVYDPNRNYGK